MKATPVCCAFATFPSGCLCLRGSYRSAEEIFIGKAYLSVFKINKYKTRYLYVLSESSTRLGISHFHLGDHSPVDSLFNIFLGKMD